MTVKKICIAIHALSYAGAERVAVSWANYLVQHGNDVFVLIYGKSENEFTLDERIRVLSVAENQAAFFAMPVWKRLWQIRKIIRREAPQTLISFLPKLQINMMLATMGMRMERIETIRNNPWMDNDVGRKRFLWDMCFRRADKIVLQTPEQGEYFDSRLQKKCTVISNPISKEFVAGKKEYSEKVRKFVAVGRLSEQKNYPFMIQAFALATANEPDCTLDIYGHASPENEKAIKAQIHQTGMEGRICLRGWTGNISAILPRYDAYLMSSDYEGMPNALAEAMAVGLVCISTNCRTGPKDMIRSGYNGYLVPLGDMKAYAEGIRTVLGMEIRECTKLGAAARETMMRMCGEEQTLARLKALIEKD